MPLSLRLQSLLLIPTMEPFTVVATIVNLTQLCMGIVGALKLVCEASNVNTAVQGLRDEVIALNSILSHLKDTFTAFANGPSRMRFEQDHERDVLESLQKCEKTLEALSQIVMTLKDKKGFTANLINQFRLNKSIGSIKILRANIHCYTQMLPVSLLTINIMMHWETQVSLDAMRECLPRLYHASSEMERSLTDDSVTVNSLTQDVQKWTSSAERAMEIANNPNIESIWDDRKTRDWLRNNGFMISELDDDARRKALTRAINENLEEVVRFLITQVGNNRARRALVAEAMALSVSVNRLQILDSLIKEESSISSSTDIIDVRLKSGHTPLIAAILDGKEEIVQRLLERRANIEVRCIKEISPLTYAVKSRDPNIVRLLLQSRLVNEKPSVVDEKTADWTPLHFAVHYGERDIVDLLLDKGANIDALCSRGLPKDESTSDPLIDTNLKRLDTNGSISTVEACCTVLNRAIVKGDDLMVQLLLRRGAKIEAATPELASALSCAAEEQFEEIVDILLQKEANVNATDRWGWTALHRAQVKPENDNVTRLLLSKGSDVEARCEKGRTALHHAAERGNTSTIPLLIEKGANIEAKDIAENTPLHIAILYRHTDMVSLLVDQGADVKAKNGDGHNALTIATQDTEKQRKCPEIIEFLKKCSK